MSFVIRFKFLVYLVCEWIEIFYLFIFDEIGMVWVLNFIRVCSSF